MSLKEFKAISSTEIHNGVQAIGRKHNLRFHEVNLTAPHTDVRETVYLAVVRAHGSGLLTTVVYTSNDGGKVREKGTDAIRTVGYWFDTPEGGFDPETDVINTNDLHPVAVPDTEYTKRLPTWASNLETDVGQVARQLRDKDVETCECGSLMERRTVNGTSIWGCVEYHGAAECSGSAPCGDDDRKPYTDASEACPDCGGAVVGFDGFDSCLSCDYSESTNDDAPDCPECERTMVAGSGEYGPYWACYDCGEFENRDE